MLNVLVMLFHVIIGICLGTAGVGVEMWQMWIIWLCIFGINLFSRFLGRYDD